MSTRAQSDKKFEALIDRVRLPRMGEIIASNIRDLILRGDLEPGDLLPSERTMTSLLEISTPTLREALRILEAESFIVVRRGAGGGPVVTLPAPDTSAQIFGLALQSQGTTIDDVFRVRQMIEPSAIRLVIERQNPQTEVILTDIVGQQREALSREDYALLNHYAVRFHDKIIELSGNKHLFIMMHMLNDAYEKHVKSAYMVGTLSSKNVRDIENAILEEEKLIRLIAEGNADHAVAHWIQYLEMVRGRLFEGKKKPVPLDVLGDVI